MILTKDILALPTTLEEFLDWESEDGFKYEWHDGKLIKFEGINKRQIYIFFTLNRLFISKGYWQHGTFVTKQDVHLSEIQIRRPDISYFTDEQVNSMSQDKDEIPEFMIEVISGNDKANKVEEKTVEYFKAGAGGVPLKVLWLIYPDNQTVQVYNSLKQAQICTDDDICSAKPVLEDFEISVNDIFA